MPLFLLMVSIGVALAVLFSKISDIGRPTKHESLSSQSLQSDTMRQGMTFTLPESEDGGPFNEFSIYGNYFYQLHVSSRPRMRSDGYYEWYCDEQLKTTDDMYRYYRRHRSEIVRQMRERGVI